MYTNHTNPTNPSETVCPQSLPASASAADSHCTVTASQPDCTHSVQENGTRFISIDCGCIHGGITLRDPALPESGNMALHVCQNAEEVLQNRKALAAKTLPLQQWALPWQKHTDHIASIQKTHQSQGAFAADTSIMDVDALYTTTPGILIGVFTADCSGILLADPTIPLVCAIHSGWKGTAQNILFKTLQHLDTQGLLHPDSMSVWFSPSLQQKSFEIGPEVKEALLAAGKEIGLDYTDLIQDVPHSDRSYADHQAMHQRVLASFGIQPAKIHTSSQDTKTDPTCFSFRRDGRSTGEHMTFGYIEDPALPTPNNPTANPTATAV